MPDYRQIEAAERIYAVSHGLIAIRDISDITGEEKMFMAEKCIRPLVGHCMIRYPKPGCEKHYNNFAICAWKWWSLGEWNTALIDDFGITDKTVDEIASME